MFGFSSRQSTFAVATCYVRARNRLEARFRPVRSVLLTGYKQALIYSTLQTGLNAGKHYGEKAGETN